MPAIGLGDKVAIKVIESGEITPESRRDPGRGGRAAPMRLPRVNIREAVAWVAVVALALGWWIEHQERKELATEAAGLKMALEIADAALRPVELKP
jgi:hypothetical protein